MTDDRRPDRPRRSILYEKDPSTKIATITLEPARPAQHPDDRHAAAATPTCLHQANIDDDVKVLVIRGVGDDLGTGADLAEFMASSAAEDGLAARGVRHRPDADVTMPAPRNFRHGATARPLVHQPARRAAAASRSSRRSASSRSRATATAGTSTKPATPTSSSPPTTRSSGTPLPLRRLRAPDVAVGDDDGAAQVPGDGLHRPARSPRTRWPSAASSTASCPATSSRPRSQKYAAGLRPATGRPTPSSCRRRSSRS